MNEVRAIVWEVIPDVEESVKYTVPFYCRNGMLCYLSPRKNHDGIYIGFAKGYLMEDEAGVFSGKDLKQIRHIVYRTKGDIKKRTLKEYLAEAVMLNELKRDKHPFPIHN